MMGDTWRFEQKRLGSEEGGEEARGFAATGTSRWKLGVVEFGGVVEPRLER
jgi:hypothetical protein